MKYTCKQHRNAFVFCLFTIAATLCGIHANAQLFNDGTTNTITSDTIYNETLFVGSQNPDNTLIIESNATVQADDVIIGQLESSTNNLVSVVGGSRLVAGDATTNGLATGGVVVGDNDGDAAISLRNASTLEADYLYVGFGTNDSGTIELRVDGTNITGTTEFNVANDAYIGYAGSTNSVDVGAQSALNIGGDLYVGFAGGSNNTVLVNDGSLFVNSTNNIHVVDPDAGNSIDIQNNGTLQVGGDVETGTLEGLGIKFASGSNLEIGGSLTLTGNTIDGGHDVILNNDLSTNTATWNSSSLSTIGKTTSGNSLTLTNGATATSTNILQVGGGVSANNNALAVIGTGSTFTGLSDVMIGSQGDHNEFVIRDGGEATISGSLYLGNNSGATGNEVMVGSNGVLNASSDVVVGDNGGNNTFTITHGQVAVGNDFILGSGSANNRYFHTGGTNTVAGEFIIGKTQGATGVTTIGATDTSGNLGSVGTNAILNIQQDLTVGQEGGGSILLIHDGGAINVDGDAIIGEASNDNYIFLQPDDPDTRFNVAGDLMVGKEGENNRFAVYGGTANIDGNLYLGSSTNQHVKKNYIHVETTNAVIHVANAIYIGASNSINTLDLVDGATVTAQDLFVGAYEGVSNNVVTVTGNDSLLSVSNLLEIGSNTGSNNAVNVGNGGTLFVLAPTNIVIGATATNDLNNRLNINSGGTLHTIDWNYATVSTNISLNSGSTLELDGIFSGTNQLDGGIELALNGALATTNWNTGTNVLYVGYETDGNTLTIKEGGLATTITNLIVGNSSKSAGNTLSSTGLSSRVVVGNNLIIGNKDSSGNSMNILGGGQINVANDFTLGSASDGNTGLLEGFAGTNSILHVTGNLTVGRNGDFNRLQISSNAIANIGGNIVVGAGEATGNEVLVGSNGVLNASSGVVVGDKGDDNKFNIDYGQVTVNNDFILGSSSANNRYNQTGGTNTVAGEFIIGRTEDASGVTSGGDTSGNLGSVGTNATLNIQQNLTVGQKGGGSILLINDGGTVSVDGDAIIGEASDDNYIFLEPDTPDSRFNVAGDLMVGMEGENNRFAIYGGTANIDGDLYLGSSTNQHVKKNYIHLETTNAVLNVANAVYIGASNSLNTLDIVDGATASAQDLFIGAYTNASENVVTVTGSNSTLDVWNDLFVGSMETNTSGNNSFQVLEAATAHIGGNLSLSSKSFLKIDYDAQVVIDGNYSQDESSILSLGISTNYSGTNLVVKGTASFSNHTTIAVYDDETMVDTTNHFTRALVTSTNLLIGGEEATQGLLNDSITNDIQIANDLLDINMIVSNNTIWIDSITRLSLASRSGLEEGTQLADIADEIDAMADGTNAVAEAMRDIMGNEMDTDGRNKAFHDYYGEKTSSSPMHNVINRGIGSIASELTIRGDSTRTRMAESAPAGAAGPHAEEQDLQGWIAGYGSWGKKDSADGFHGFDANLSGFIIGVDFAASKDILVGLAAGSNGGSVDKDNGASGDTRTTYGAVYTSVGTKDWFLDGSVIYGASSIDNTIETQTEVGTRLSTTAEYDAQNIAFYLGGGKEIIGEYLIITPQASLLVNYYKQDEYEETSSTSNVVGRLVDSFDALYVQSSLGCSLGLYTAMGEVVLKPELRAHWLHEFTGEESLPYQLIDGNGSMYNMLLQAPEADILKLGAGVAAMMSEYLELRFDLDTRWGSNYSDYTVTGSLRYQF